MMEARRKPKTPIKKTKATGIHQNFFVWRKNLISPIALLDVVEEAELCVCSYMKEPPKIRGFAPINQDMDRFSAFVPIISGEKNPHISLGFAAIGPPAEKSGGQGKTVYKE